MQFFVCPSRDSITTWFHCGTCFYKYYRHTGWHSRQLKQVPCSTPRIYTPIRRRWIDTSHLSLSLSPANPTLRCPFYDAFGPLASTWTWKGTNRRFSLPFIPFLSLYNFPLETLCGIGTYSVVSSTNCHVNQWCSNKTNNTICTIKVFFKKYREWTLSPITLKCGIFFHLQ